MRRYGDIGKETRKNSGPGRFTHSRSTRNLSMRDLKFSKPLVPLGEDRQAGLQTPKVSLRVGVARGP
jgi:hypothetical protein